MDKERLFKLLDRKYCSKSEIIPNIPLGEDADAIWAEILQSRRARGIELPLTNLNGDAYWYILTGKMISASEVIVNELMEQETAAEPHKSSVSTIEEIYYTGFMEGAQISVQDAMEFLQSGEEPESVEELILLNSRQAAGFAAENMYHAIDSNYLHNLAYFLTEGLDNGSGDFRMTDTVEIPSMQGESVRLPPADMIPEQMERFAVFLADTTTHPLIKAAAAQAWVLAYRPFPEGNERLARLLSNVILIRAGYGFFGEISISSILAQTSYEYFRAIANILRIENGADLTYFLEYYLVSLSAAVNEMKARRIQQAEAVVEAEQKLAAVPLQAPKQETAASHIGNPTLLAIHEERVQKVKVGLDTLMAQGVEQFTLGDLSDVTGISRKYLSKLIRPYEDSEQVIAVRKAKTGNIYAFNHSAPPDENDATEELEQKELPNIDTDLREYVISALKKRSSEGQCIVKAVAQMLLGFIQSEKYSFTIDEIAHDLDITTISAQNSIHYYFTHEMIRRVNEQKNEQLYEFCFIPVSTNSFSSVENIISEGITPESYLEAMRDSSTGRNQVAIAETLLKYLHNGRPDFSSFDVAEELHISPKTVNNHFRVLQEKHVIVLNRTLNNIKYYRFSDMTTLVPQDEISMEYVVFKLKEIANTNKKKKGQIAQVFLRYLQEGKLTFKTEEITAETGLENDEIHNALRVFRERRLIKRIGARPSVQHGFCSYRFNIHQETEEKDLCYSDAVIDTICMLEKSENSPKDRRIAKIIRKCLAKGTVTKDDYSAEGELSKWGVDMRFAVQLGLLEKVSSSEYRIMPEVGNARTKLGTAQKCTLSALYDIFGDGIFSAEMVVANLDYSSSHVSGILHQFTMLKLLDCTPNEDSTYSYQLTVNPTDDPECFENVA